MTRLAVLVLPALISSGCFIYSGDDDCEFGGGGADLLVVELRNPFSGQCEAGGGGGPCDPAYEGDERPMAPLDWATCYGGCEGLDEQTCLATPACRGAYTSNCLEWDVCSEETFTFFGCWGTAPSGPVQGGECVGLGAEECSRHDDCVAHHYAGAGGCGGGTEGGGADCAPIADPAQTGNFKAYAPEPTAQQGCYEDWECPSGETCNSEELCLPGPYSCGSAEADALVPCDTRCYGYCVPTDVDPGNCYEPAFCDSLPPTCPTGTIAGVRNGCWSGYCIPTAECPDQPPACEGLGEEACLANGNCTPHYEGVNCSMVDGVWVCEYFVFTTCITGATDSP